MKAKAYFQQVAHAEHDLKLLRAQLRHYRDMGYSITGGSIDSPVVCHSRGSSRVEASAVGIYDITRRLEEQERQCLDIISKANAVIEKMKHEKYRDILTYRYLCGWSWKSISDDLRYKDEKSVYRAHGWALMEAQEILNKIEGGK